MPTLDVFRDHNKWSQGFVQGVLATLRELWPFQVDFHEKENSFGKAALIRICALTALGELYNADESDPLMSKKWTQRSLVNFFSKQCHLGKLP